MADTKLTSVSATTTPIGTDITYVVDDPGGSPASKKMELQYMRQGLTYQFTQKTADYTLTLGDTGTALRCNKAGSTQLITIPRSTSTDFVNGSTILLVRQTTQIVRLVADTGVQILAQNSYVDIGPRYGAITIVNVSGNIWFAFGDLVAT